MRLNYILPFLITLITIYSGYSQQITTDDSLPLEQLIQESLGQSCVEISDISSSVNGVNHGFNSFGYFERNNSNFPFQNGILLTTGSVNSAGNMMNTNPLNEGHDAWLTDADLENALGITNTQNATSIQFNFTSIANQIQFNYLLASEEYQQEFPCFYSDGFAFLIREAGSTSPYTNIALVPGTSTPVNTNTIHDEIEGFCAAENETLEVLVIDAPKFFTPNNDTKYDTWHIVGIETLPGSIIYIFDRQGKLITQLSANTPGWDGTLNGYNLPASDYWFSAEIKQDNKAFKVQGHFALRR